MSNNTRVYRGREGWSAESVVPLADSHSLRVSTYKSNRGGIATFVTRVLDAPDGSFSFEMFEDYSRMVAEKPKTRATEKTVAEQHAFTMARIDEIKAEVAAFYAAKAAR